MFGVSLTLMADGGSCQMWMFSEIGGENWQPHSSYEADWKLISLFKGKCL